jgi:hypothetical protein
MRNILLLPEKYQTLKREELIDAFLGTYYELIISIPDEDFINELIEYLNNSIKYINSSNEVLWKCIWLSFFDFTMYRMKYMYFCDCIKKERICIETLSNDEFLRFLFVLNIASGTLTRKGCIIETPRLQFALDGGSEYEEQIRKRIIVKEKEIDQCIEKYKELFEFQSEYINRNNFFDHREFVYHNLIIMLAGEAIEITRIYEWFAFVIKVNDPAKFMNLCTELYNIIKGL